MVPSVKAGYRRMFSDQPQATVEPFDQALGFEPGHVYQDGDFDDCLPLGANVDGIGGYECHIEPCIPPVEGHEFCFHRRFPLEALIINALADAREMLAGRAFLRRFLGFFLRYLARRLHVKGQVRHGHDYLGRDRLTLGVLMVNFVPGYELLLDEAFEFRIVFLDNESRGNFLYDHRRFLSKRITGH
jgi:hypothetical protein